MKKLEEKVGQCKPKLMSFKIVVEMRSRVETTDKEGPWGDPNLVPNKFAIIIASQAIRNQVVKIKKRVKG